MQRDLRRLADQSFDLLIIGGGIFGAGVARDAALRGLHVALVERADFASGTSCRSSKLIHGGFRYLEQHEFGLVAESTRERRILQEIAPHRVKPLAFLLPVYDQDPRPLWLMRLGMTLYDALAMFRTPGLHRTLSAEDVLKQEPGLDPVRLKGAIRYYDCQEDDARFCLDNILHASQLGAVCANYCQVTGFNQTDGRVIAADVSDRIGGESFQIRAKTFVNAAGPWVDRVANLIPAQDAGKRPTLSPTKGAHILIPRLTQHFGVFFQGRRDGRMMFILPWNDCTLVGTTDTDFQGNPADVRAEPADVDYLLTEVKTMFPQSSVGRTDVIATIAGVRPLLKSDAADPSARSREHQLIRAGENFLSLCGGKYTTYRLVADQAVDEVYKMLGAKPPHCRTGTTPLPDFRVAADGSKLSDHPKVHESDVTQAVNEEMAMTVEDVMWRRTGLMLSQSGGREVAQHLAQLAQPLLGWSDQKRDESLEDYLAQRNRPF